MKRSKTVEDYLESSEEQWKKSLIRLRKLLLKTELVETVKWGMPVYTIDNKNVIGLASFKHHFGLWFYQGVFLSDPHEVLENAQEGKTKGMRHLRYKNENELGMKLVKEYVIEAIENQKQGKVITIERSKKKYHSPYLELILSSDKKLTKRFNALTNFKQQEYHEYISTAKQEKTKERRMEKSSTLILKGKGLNDQYR